MRKFCVIKTVFPPAYRHKNRVIQEATFEPDRWSALIRKVRYKTRLIDSPGIILIQIKHPPLERVFLYC